MNKKNVRYNILIMLVYIIGIILLIRLFNLQIVHGKEYYETSSNRLTRETILQAARGDIVDRNGSILASTKTEYSVEIYRSKIDNETLNNTLLELVKLLENNGDSYRDNLPISADGVNFDFKSEESIKNWLKNNNLDENLTAIDVINKYKEKYEIKNDNIEETRKIIGIRYGITKEGYSSMKSYTISNNVSNKTVAMIEEQNLKFPGVSIETTAKRQYLNENLASHVIGYIGRINQEELENHEDYLMNDYIGKTGIEYVFEPYLRGINR